LESRACSPAFFDDEPAEVAAAIRATRVDLVAPIVTAAAHQREALLVLGTKRSEEPYDRDDRELVGSPDAADRFRREALVAASFAHPNVVTVYDFVSPTTAVDTWSWSG
jgi:hypothetical protein